MLLSISIYSKNLELIKNLLQFLFNLNKVNKRLRLKTYYKLKSSKKTFKLFSLLKSPHVNKTAQTQFSSVIYKKQVVIYTPHIFKFLIFFKKLKRAIAGVRLTIKLKYNFKYYSRKCKTLLNPNNVYLPTLDKSCKRGLKYLKLLDIYGEICFFTKFKTNLVFG